MGARAEDGKQKFNSEPMQDGLTVLGEIAAEHILNITNIRNTCVTFTSVVVFCPSKQTKIDKFVSL